MLYRSALVVALLAGFWPSLAVADPPGPSVTNAAQNVRFVVSQLCGPFVLDHVEMAALNLKRPFIAPDGAKDPATGQPLLRVGVAGDVHVLLKQTAQGRSCDVFTSHVSPADVRNAFLAAI